MAIRLPNSNESIIGYDTLQTDEVNETKNDFTTKINQLLNWMGLVKDYVIETGSNTNGNWEKWNSGKLVQWGKKTVTHNGGFSEQWVNMFYCPTTIITYPISFVGSLPINKTKGFGVGADCWSVSSSQNQANLLNAGGFYLIRPAASASSLTAIYDWESVGRWKL